MFGSVPQYREKILFTGIPVLGKFFLEREGKSALISGLGLATSIRELAFLNPSRFVLNNVSLKFVISLWILTETAAIRAYRSVN